VELRELKLDSLVLDPNLYLRDRLDDFTVERYADSWERLPPLSVYEVSGKLLLADGWHRHAAAVMLGKRTIKCEVLHGTFTDALDFVASVNLFHGLPLTRSERRRAVEVKLTLHYDWSDRRMAEELAVSRELVAKTRKHLIDSKKIPNIPGRVGADGKMYTSAGIPREPTARAPKAKAGAPEPERPREKGAREVEPPWEEPAKGKGKPVGAGVEIPDAKKIALSEPVPPVAPTIEEMLALMAKQIMEVITWTQAEGFTEAYRTASGNARGLFQTAVFKLAARADQLRKA
jgi:hypothetical protein